VSALAEALVAAQRRALAQLEKAYVRDAEDDLSKRTAGFLDALTQIGLTDREDGRMLVTCLEVLRVTGGALPSEPTNGGEPKPPEPASDAQLALIADLVKRKNVPAPDLPLTKVDASAIISSLQAGTYDPAKWSVPF